MNMAETIAAAAVDLERDMLALGNRARDAATILATAPTADKQAALQAMASRIRASQARLLEANQSDVARAEATGKPASFIDRLTLTVERIEAMAQGLEAVAALPDPVGAVMANWQRPNGLDFTRVRVPIGVIGIIYESRPNVTADAGALAMMSGNAAILRGGSDSHDSSGLIVECLQAGLEEAGLPKAAIQMVPTPDRAAVGMMLQGLGGTVDLIVPRGGKSLVGRVQDEARVPVFAHLEGICHVYVDKAADPVMAVDIITNAKMRRTGVCGAAECVLVHEDVVASHAPAIINALRAKGCEVHADQAVNAVSQASVPASDADWGMEFLDAVIAMKSVTGLDDAMDHIARFGSQHTDCIITDDADTAVRFLNEVDSAIVMHNASTQFADGGEFGFGAEIGIATGKLHARGPVGLEQLTTFKYQVRGSGQTRP
ncbi:glutamate-5-semialdehyde dehydrogenase [Anderseniella sp. Alg231-50]|uniref:glutamate-5-semialdehyde dehydrogenase n=1 Tax=Anderseniella sp. Alg231-50 TaxID=1922226 RepID=UPI003FCCD7F7